MSRPAPPPGSVAADGAGWVCLVCHDCELAARAHRIDARPGRAVRSETVSRLAQFAVTHNGHRLELVAFGHG